MSREGRETGFVLLVLGGLVVAAAMLFSEGYGPSLGFYGSLMYTMEINVFGVVVPTPTVLFLGLVLAAGGVLLMRGGSST